MSVTNPHSFTAWANCRRAHHGLAQFKVAEATVAPPAHHDTFTSARPVYLPYQPYLGG